MKYDTIIPEHLQGMEESARLGDSLVLDFEVLNHGSVIQIKPLNENASQWLEDNVSTEGWQWMGSYLCGDSRPMQELLEALTAEGFEL